MPMNLVITTPTAIVVSEDDIRYIRAEDLTGTFGIQPGHADFLTALAISVLIWRDASGAEHYAAIRGGVLRVRDGKSVEVATREAIIGTNLKHLREIVLAQMASNAEIEKAARVGVLGLQQAAVQQIYRYLRPGEPSRDPLVRQRR
ncbi:MAG TPA: F0F1 ATP synthase subunit epsilon [Candidatus Binataceae bacterium]|nr:F0F1 ATP synthase subunit epsilon [Candidatus Binataceae bacterium]